MNRINLIIRQKIFIIAIALMLVFAGFLIYWYLNASNNEKQLAGGNIYIYTSRIEIKAGTQITKDMIEKKSIPGNIYNQKFITNVNEITGKVTVLDIVKGEIISSDKVQGVEGAKESSYLAFSSYIPAGLRAVSIPVNYYGEKSLLSVGDNVDLISTLFEKTTDSIISRTILRDKEIILIDGKNSSNDLADLSGQKGTTSASNDLPAFDSILKTDTAEGLKSGNCILTLYLKPIEAETVFLALQTGTINLSICPKNISGNFKKQ
jgi:Flp pilus assembly protein CpaB